MTTTTMIRFACSLVNMVDYSKWANIEVSDDEDEVHPNIDTPSLFRWRHQARLEREVEAKKEKESVSTQSLQAKVKLEQTVKQLEKLKTSGDSEKISKLENEIHDLEEQTKKWKQKEDEIAQKEKMTPWNVDTLSKEGFSSTSINKYKPKDDDSDLTEEEKHARFIEKNEKEIKKYGMYRRWDDTGEFLQQHTELVREETANYLVIWAIDLMSEKKESLMEQVAHQTIVLQFILELAKSLNKDPRSCIRPFFEKVKSADKKYMESFHEELTLFKGRIRKKAQERIDRAMKEAEEEMEREKQARLGPGGLDPVEVFESLPAELQACFESKDISMLQKVVGELEPADADYHIKRCVESGLWVPGAGDKVGTSPEGGATAGENGDTDLAPASEEPTYESV